MGWNFKQFNNYRAQLIEKNTDNKYLIERFSTNDYGRLRMFKLDGEMVLDPLKVDNKGTNLLDNFKESVKSTKKSKPAVNDFDKISEEFKKSREMFMKATGMGNSFKREEIVLVEEEEGFLTLDDLGPYDDEEEEDMENTHNTDSDEDGADILDLEDALGFINDMGFGDDFEEDSEIEDDDTHGMEFEEEEEQKVDFSFDKIKDKEFERKEEDRKAREEIVKQEISGSDGKLETDRDKGESLLDLLLGFEDQNSEIIGREFIDTEPTYQDQIVMYDMLETFQKTEGADLLVEHQFGDKPMSIRITNMINDYIQILPINREKVVENFLLKGHNIKSKDEVSYKEYTGKTVEGEEVRVVEILNLDGLPISKYFETEEYELRVFLDQGIRSFKDRLDILPKTPYLKSIKPNPYRVKRNIGQDHKIIQLPPIEYFKSFLNLDHVETSNYWIADTEEKLIKVKEKIESLHPDHIIAYDAETTGLNFHAHLPDEERDVLVTHSFSWEDNQSVIIPIRMQTRRNIEPEVFKKHMKEIMETRRFLVHNGPADIRFNMPDGIRLNVVEDTYFLSKHLMPYLQVDEMSGKSRSRSNVTRGLDALVKRMFNVDLIDMNKYVFRPAGIQFDFSIMNDDYLIYYGCPDTDLLRKLWKIWRPKLESIQENAYNATVRSACIMSENASYYGLALSEDIIFGGKERAEKTADYLEEVALKLVGETKDTLKIGSAKQLANFMYGKYGVPVTEETKRTPKGELSADKEVLEELAVIKDNKINDTFKEDLLDAEGNVVRVGRMVLTKEYLNSLKYPFCAIVRAWSDQTSDITANYNRLLNKAKGGIYYPEYRMGATATWRSTEGLQTVKSSLKDGLGVYDDEYYLLSMDFAAEELRLAVNQSDDDAFKNILEHPESDPHTSAGADIFEMEQYQVDRAVRNKAKACNFGIIYGMGPYTLATSMFNTRFPTQEDVDEATDTYNRYVYRFSEMIKALQPARKEIEKNGYTYNNLGFKIIYDDVLDLDDFEEQIFDQNDPNPPTVRLDPLRYDQYIGSLMNKAGNFPIQSWGAGLLMFFIISMDKRLREEGLENKVKMPIIVHDEVGLIIHESVDPYHMMKIMIEVFELDMQYLERRTVPLYLGIGYAQSWGEAGSDEAEIPVKLQHLMKKEFEEGRSPTGLKATEIKDHFQNRIKDYMQERLTDTLKEQVDSRVYKTGDVVDIMRDNIFVLNKGNEVFGFYNPGADKYDHRKIVDIISKQIGIDPLEIEIVETKPTPPVEVDEDNDIIDFFYEPMVHNKLTSIGDVVIVDCTGLRRDITQNLLKYLMYFNDPDNKKSKQLMMKLGSKTIQVNGYKLTGLPLTAGTVIDDILDGKQVPIRRKGKIVRLEIPLQDVIYKKTPEKQGNKIQNIINGDSSYYVLDLDVYDAENRQEKLKEIVETLHPSLSEIKGEELKIKVNGGYQVFNLKLKGIPVPMLEKLSEVIQV